MGARSGETEGRGEGPSSGGQGMSALLTQVAEELRQERKRLEPRVGWQALAEAEREIAAAIATEARRRLRERVARREAEARAGREEEGGEYQRFSLTFRLQHIGLFVSTLVLIVTGLPLRYAEMVWARNFFGWIGGVPVQAFTHRAAAALLIVVGIFHTGYVALTQEGRRELRALLPRAKDVADLFHNLAHFVGLTRGGPRFDRFSYVEKFDYWAVYWGIAIMVGSGLMLWSPAVTMRYLPKYLLDITQTIHSDEALLAAAAIIIWHFYNVHFNPDCFPMNWAWLTGRISRERMKRHHPLEWERHLGGEDGGSGAGSTSAAPGESDG